MRILDTLTAIDAPQFTFAWLNFFWGLKNLGIWWTKIKFVAIYFVDNLVKVFVEFKFNIRADWLQMWGESIECEQDVWDVFTRYLTGEPNKNGVQVIIVKFLTMNAMRFIVEPHV